MYQKSYITRLSNRTPEEFNRNNIPLDMGSMQKVIKLLDSRFGKNLVISFQGEKTKGEQYLYDAGVYLIDGANVVLSRKFEEKGGFVEFKHICLSLYNEDETKIKGLERKLCLPENSTNPIPTNLFHIT